MSHNSRKVLNKTLELHGYHISTIPSTGRNLNRSSKIEVFSRHELQAEVHAFHDWTWNDPQKIQNFLEILRVSKKLSILV